MEYEVIVTNRASLDLEDAIDWYNQKQKDLGVDFLLSFYSCLDALSTFPNRHPKVYKAFRRMIFKEFPYSIFFQVDENQRKVIVLALWANKRNPQDLEDKLG